MHCLFLSDKGITPPESLHIFRKPYRLVAGPDVSRKFLEVIGRKTDPEGEILLPLTHFSRINANPFKKLLCIKKNTIRGGIIAINTPAIITPQLFIASVLISILMPTWTTFM